jgi:hypothetical protein
VHQYGLPGRDAEQVQDPLGRLTRHRQRDRVLPVEAGGLGGHGGGQRVLGVRAGVRPAQHLIADLHVAHALTQGVHHAGEFATGDGGEWRGEPGLQCPGTDLAVQRVQPGRPDTDADLLGAGLRSLDVGLVQHFRASETVEQDGFHDDFSTCRHPLRWLDT